MRVYNSDLEYIYRIRDFQAMTVTRRYTGTGTVKLVFAAEDAANYYLQKNHFIVIDDEPFVVKHIEQGLEKCIIQAYSCHALLDQRITGKGENKVEQIVSVGSPDAVVKDFVNRCKGDLPITTKPNQAADFNIKEVTRLKKLGEEVQRILDLYSMGEKFTIENEVLYFDTYQGQDRTIELVFSAERGNLDELNYIESAVDDKTTIYVGGAGQGADREMVLVGDEWEGLDRIEVFRDARDVEAGDTDELINRAEKLLTSTQKAITATLVSGEYTLGDLVTVRIVRTGLDGNNADDQVTNLQLRITAETISCQDGEEHIDLQFGTIPLIDNDPVKELRSQMAQMETAEVPLERVTEQLKQDLEQTIIGQVGNLNEFANSLAGLYTTKITLPDDSKIIYSHDEPLLEDSNFIATQSAGAYAWTTTGWNDGHPAWQYGVDQTGNAIFRLISTVGLNADWIHTGRIESFDGSAWIDLDTGYFKLGHMSLDQTGFKLDVAANSRNYLLDSGAAVNFAEQSDIATSVQGDLPEYEQDPTELEYAKQYQLAEPLKLNTDYTLSVEGQLDDWTGVWLGDGYFAGYLENGQLGIECKNYFVISTSVPNKMLSWAYGMESGETSSLLSDYIPLLSTPYYCNFNIEQLLFYTKNKEYLGAYWVSNGVPTISKARGSSISAKTPFIYPASILDEANYIRIGFRASFLQSHSANEVQLKLTSGFSPYTPNPADFDNIIIKSLTDTATIDRVMLSQSTTGQDWQPAPEDVQALLDKKANTDDLGDLAYDDLVELAKLGTTIIQGGYIKTDLLHIGSGSSYAAGYDPSKIPYIGANYFLESGVPVTSNQYLIKTYTPFTPLTEGRQYTITATVTPAAGVTHLAPVTSNGYHGLPNMAVTGTNKQTVSITFNIGYATGRKPSDNISNANVGIYRIPNDGSVTGNTTIHQIKVEEGGKATAWVPAAEDSTEKNQLAKNLGYTDYAAMMTQALAGKTIISGGLINTQLLTANNIITGKMSSANGKTYFDLDAAKILQQATVAGKDVRVEMSTAKPFSLQMKDALDRWQGYVYVTDASGYSGPNILVTSRYDINEDGVVDNEDVLILSKYMMKEDIAPGIPWPNGYPPFERMDLNSDGFVNSMDITMLIRESNHKPMIANIHNVLGIDSDGVWYSDDWGDTKKRASTTIYGTGQNGWSNANGIRGFRTAEGIIMLSFSMIAGTITTNTLVATIQASIRPKYTTLVEVYDVSYQTLNDLKLVIASNGDIYIRGVSNFVTGRRYDGACSYMAVS